MDGVNIAIIPARGGSKGIPRKNLRLAGGKPLVVHSIEQALESGVVSRVLVSTDDPEIARVSAQHGAQTVWRPAEISGDEASSESALLHALDWFAEKQGRDPDLVVFLQATSPLREPDDIRRAVRTLEEAGADSLLSASPLQGFVWRVENGRPRSFNYDHENRPRRQDAPDDLVENGSIYVFKPWVLRRFQNRLGGAIAVYRMDGRHYFQIDEPGDLDLIEALMKQPRARVAGALAGVRLLALDFDGVMTDNRVWVDENGREAVVCSRADGMGLAALKRSGVEPVVLSTETNPVVAARCRKLGIQAIQGLSDKLPALRALAEERRLDRREVAYVGNDWNDLECMRWAGVPIAVADAVIEARRAARVVLSRAGGRGAVREVCELILQNQSSEPGEACPVRSESGSVGSARDSRY